MATIKQGDRYDLTLSAGNIDLAGATLTCRARNVATRVVYELAVSAGEEPGTVIHPLTGTLPAGLYHVEITIDRGAADYRTAPTVGAARLEVVERIPAT